MGVKKELGQKIKRMRINRGFTQEVLAEKAEISQRALSSIESGENFVTAETLDKLMLALNTTVEEIFAINHLKTGEELKNEIYKNINKLMYDASKLEIIYIITNSLLRE